VERRSTKYSWFEQERYSAVAFRQMPCQILAKKHRSATDTRTRVASATSAAEMKTPDPLWTIL